MECQVIYLKIRRIVVTDIGRPKPVEELASWSIKILEEWCSLAEVTSVDVL